MSQPRPVVVIGGSNLDIRARTATGLNSATSNPGRTVITAGGVARNIAENLARLGTRTVLVSRVGDDDFGHRLLRTTRDAGVDVRRVLAGPEPTGTYTAVLDADGELSVGVADMAGIAGLDATAVQLELLDRGLIHQASHLVLDGNLPVATVARALGIARDHDIPVVLDPVGQAKAAALGTVLKPRQPVHTITPDRAELLGLTGEDNVDAAVAHLHARGVGTVWLTDGGNGSTLYDADGTRTPVPARRVQPVDVTGAGDALVAAYVHALVGGRSRVEAATFATAAARLTVASPYTVRPDLSAELVQKALADQHPDQHPDQHEETR